MRALGLVACAGLLACGGESSPPVDAPVADAPVADAATDAVVDAATTDSAEVDAAIDAVPIDAAEIDAPTDAAVDAPADAPTDAPTDAPIDAPPTGTSCAAIHAAFSSAPDGIYTIDPDGAGPDAPFDTYCDMTTDGGGWTLVSYGYRTAGNTMTPYYLPYAAQGTWTPAARNNFAAVDGRELLDASTQIALTVTNNALVTGNVYGYAKSYVWSIPSPQTAVMTFADPSPTGCVTVSVRELHTGAAFDALSLQAKPLQVSCSGHKGGTPYERQLLGFNSQYCYGACGSDPVTSMGMVVWYGDGYSPTTSGGDSWPERPASFAVWFK